MADRFPLIVNAVSKKIEELISGDSLDLTGSGIAIGGSNGTNGQYLKTDGSTVLWDSPGDVFLTQEQTLTNKTLDTPTLLTPDLGVASATSINGLAITTINSGTLSIGDTKVVTISNTLSFSGTDSSSVDFGAGGTVLYDNNLNFANLSEGTSAQLRAIISDETGTGLAVFNTSPAISTSITTSSESFDLLNTTVTTVNAFGSGTDINIGATSGDTTVNNNFVVAKNFTANSGSTDTFTVVGQTDFQNNDISIRGNTAKPMTLGRGGAAVDTNTGVGYAVLNNNATGARSTAVGSQAALNSDADDNTAVGNDALLTASTGGGNTAVGSSAARVVLSGANNTSLGFESQYTNSTGDANVTIGYRAGYNITGTGNVIIGPADEATVSDSATYGAAGDRQLIIGSGPTAWITGDSSYNLSLGNATSTVTVNNDLTVTGDLLVSGDTVTVNVGTIEVEDKNILLGKVETPTDALANDGGIILKGETDKSIKYVNSVTSWSSSENFNLFDGKSYRINDVEVLSETQIGPTTSSETVSLGAAVTGSSLTSVGTLTALAVNNTAAATISGDLTVATSLIKTDTANSRVGIGQVTPGATLDVAGDIRMSGSDPEFQMNSGGPRLKVPAANTLTVHTSGDLNSTTGERIRLTGTALGYGTNNPQSYVHLAQNDNLEVRVQRTAGITDGINLGKITFWDINEENAYIQGSRDGAGGAGKIQVYCKDTAGTMSEHTKFAQNGDLEIIDGNLVVAGGKGIDFSDSSDASGAGVQVVSEILDEYEEGTWTPVDSYGYKYVALTVQTNGAGYTAESTTSGTTTVVTGSGNSDLRITYDSLDAFGNPVNVRVLEAGTGYADGDIISIDSPNVDTPTTFAQYTLVFPKGTYTRVGDMVSCTFDVTYEGTAGTGNAGEQVLIGGLPFGVKASTGTDQAWGAFITYQEYTGADNILIRAVPGASYVECTLPGGADLTNSAISQQRLAGTIIYKGA